MTRKETALDALNRKIPKLTESKARNAGSGSTQKVPARQRHDHGGDHRQTDGCFSCGA